LLSTEYHGAAANYDFRCTKGHEFLGRLSNLKFRNHFCPVCEGRQVRGAYPTYEEAAAFARTLEIESAGAWKNFTKSKLYAEIAETHSLPKAPDSVYRGKGWKGWSDWLDSGRTAHQNRKFRSFEEARDFARCLGLRSQMEWKQYAKGELKGFDARPDDIPSNPYDKYRHEGWISWPDWLGKV
jgi:hypothetical protein